ncbi:MAG: S49 family peptidase [Rhodospirillaceae bacterium]
MTMLLRIAERALNRPLLIHPDKVPLILGVLEGRIPVSDAGDLRKGAEERIEALPDDARAVLLGPGPNASRFYGSSEDVDPQTGQRSMLPYRRTKEGVALIPVIGTLVNRGAWVGSYSGTTSYEGLKFQLEAAANDPRVSAIVLDIESPGGEAVGTFEVAQAVRAANAKKPVTAMVNGMAASAAYAIASGAGRIVTTATAITGSIGVVLLHADYSRFLDKKGVTPTLIFAGAHKVDGNPFEPLPEPVRDDMQAEVNRFYDLFVETVAAGRKGLSPAAIRATEARVFIGADAVDAGLADAVGTFEEVLAELSRGPTGRSTSTQPKGATMDKTTGAPAASAGNEETVTRATHEAALAAARAEGRAAGAAEAAKAERERILGIQGAMFAGQEAMAKGFIDDGKTSAVEAALAFNQALKAAGPDHVAQLRAMDAQVRVPANPAATVEDKPKATPQTPDGWKAEYEASEALQAEFGIADRYVAFKQGERDGRVRVLKSANG